MARNAKFKALNGLLLIAILLENAGVSLAGPYPSLGGHVMYLEEEVVGERVLSRHRREIPTPGDRDGCKPGGTPPSTVVDTEAEVQQLRSKMAAAEIKAFIIPMDDAHQSEYVSNHDKRIKFISGFTGSAGTAVVLAEDKAALWVDGRYFLQGEQQLDCQWTLMKSGLAGVPTLTGWLKEVLQSGDKVGADPKLLSYDKWRSYKQSLEDGDLELVEQDDLINPVWDSMGRPPPPSNPLLILGMEFSGKSWQDKVETVRQGWGSTAESAIYTALDEVAWLLNMRGSDVNYNPVFYAYIVVKKDKITLYLMAKNQRLTTKVARHLNTGNNGACQDFSDCVEVKDYEDFYPDILALRRGPASEKVWVSPMSSYAVYSSLGNTEAEAKAKAYVQPSLVRSLKGRKNPTEVEGLRKCHIRDSAAVMEFLASLEKDIKEGKREWDEITASDELQRIRESQEYNKGLSFATISASGPNGAVIHYKATEATKRPITTSDIYLLDSGGQYLDGTTDVTRTFHFGEPTDFQKEAYTRVLMGVIDLASAVWPPGTYGRDLDAFARRPLWAAGLDYRHGTGHGIGAYLNVHEGPGRIALGYRSRAHEETLKPKMFFSDEPGYYQDNEFGIRLETIVMTTAKQTENTFGHNYYMGFDTFTLVPFEPHLIKLDLLSASQRQWLNEYHQKVQEEVGEKVLKAQGKMEAYDWLKARTGAVPATPVFSDSSAPLYSKPHPLILLAICLFTLALLPKM